MSVVGIDQEKCNRCKQCMIECGRGYFKEEASGKIYFDKTLETCNLCGHCIAVCKEDAVLTEGLDDIITFPEINSPGLLVPYENLLKFVKSKRSTRRYKKKKVPRELLEKVLDVMRYAPSASNSRGWKINIVTNEEKIKALSDAAIQGTYQYMGFQEEESARKYFKSIDRDPILLKAPAVIFVSCSVGMPATDTAIIITHGRLAAHSLGLGTCWIGMMQLAIPLNKNILKIAGIGEKDRVQGVFTIGYPAVKYHRTVPRLPLDIDGL